MLTLRRGNVTGVDPLQVRVGAEARPAWADPALVRRVEEGDEVVVNTVAADLGLGSGGFDIVVANLTRGVDGEPGGEGHVIKLNYTPVQHPVDPVEPAVDERSVVDAPLPSRRVPVLVLALHGQLAAAAWAFARAVHGLSAGYVQTAGGALPGGLSRMVPELRGRGLLAGHVTAAPAYGGEREAMSVTGALHACVERLGWDAVIAGPGPGIVGSASAYGHGGMAALDTAHAALGLGLPALVAPRVSSGDPRPRHRGVSHHTRAVLDRLLAPVRVAYPAGDTRLGGLLADASAGRHPLAGAGSDLEGYASSGLPAETMGRGIDQDADFFACALAAGSALGEAATHASEGGRG